MARLCKNCIHCKSIPVGYVSFVHYCNISKTDKLTGKKLGIHPWCKTPHPKCPIKRKGEKNNE